MNINTIFRLIISIVLTTSLFCCQKPDVGFFSKEGIEMREDTLEVIRGIYQISGIPYVDGSTRPITFELVAVRDLTTGNDVPEFLHQKYGIALWNSPFDATTDTTMELVNQKLYTSSENPLQINPRSGQLAFNSATVNLPEGLYGVDVRATNSKSSKVFENFGIVKLMAKPFQRPGNFGDYFFGISADGTESGIANRNPFSTEEHEQIDQNIHPYRKIYKVGESDIVELEMVVKDSEGTPFPPEAIKRWYDASAGKNYNSYHDNSLPINGSSEKVSFTDTSCIFRFPTVPYPAFGSRYNDGDNIYLVYYSIDNTYWDLTDEYQQIVNTQGVVYPSYQVRFKNSYKINEPGKWLMEVISPYVIYNGKK